MIFKIDDADVSNLGVYLLHAKYTPGSIDNGATKGTYRAFFTTPGLTHAPGILDLYIAIIATTTAAAVAQAMERLLGGGAHEITAGTEYYKAVLASYEPIKTAGDKVATIHYSFTATRHGELVTATNVTGCMSSVPYTECIISATAPEDGTFTVAGVKFSSLEAGDEVEIDGINMTIKVNGENAAASATFTRFPTLTQGENSFTANPSTDVTIKHYPVYM